MLLVAVAIGKLAAQPISTRNAASVLSEEGAQQFDSLTSSQQEAVITELRDLAIGVLDAKSVRFSPKFGGKVRLEDGVG